MSQAVTFGLVEKANVPDHRLIGDGGQADALSSGNVSLMNCQVNGAALSLGLQQTGLEMLASRSSGLIVFHHRSAATASRRTAPWPPSCRSVADGSDHGSVGSPSAPD